MIPKGPPVITIPRDEIRQIEEKQRQRQVLREYIIKERSNPFRSAASQGHGYIPDPAISRYESARNFASDHRFFKPTFRTTRFFLAGVIGPMIAIGFVSEYYRRTFDSRCRRGEVSYASRNNKFV